MNYLTQPILQVLFFLYNILGHNLGWSIIVLTLLVQIILFPLSLPALKSAKKMQELKPHLDKLKAKHKDDKVKLQQAQLDLYKQHGVNPASGCLPQIVRMVILIALYQVFIGLLNSGQINGTRFATSFFWLDLAKPDPIYVLPILAAVSQLIFSLMMSAGVEHHLEDPEAKKKKAEEDNLEMATALQQQMIFMMPIMTGLVALRFPSGLALYWVTSTVVSAIQQYIVSGPGGLVYYFNRIKLLLVKKQ